MRRALALLLSAPGVPAQDWTVEWTPERLRRAVELASADLEGVERAFFAGLETRSRDPRLHALFGWDPPGTAVSLALGRAFLFAFEGRDADAEAALGLLQRFADYRARVPAALAAERVEYAQGLPAVPSFFQLQDYAKAYRLTRTHAHGERRRVVEEAIAGSAEFTFTFPEWGAHNRAILRAECLAEAAAALPEHPRAPRWRALAETLAQDSVGRWEIEDAQHYQPIWWRALTAWATTTGRTDVLRSIPVRYYPRAWLDLLAPDGMVPDYGDAHFGGAAANYLFAFTLAARLHADPELQWAAERVYAFLPATDPERPDLGRALLAARLREHGAPPVPERAPTFPRTETCDELVAKKVVLRTGFGADDAYLLLNYRDEGDFGWSDRRFLRETLAVEEEKMHHGHADENAIVRFMDGPDVLLRDAGYRPTVPSGPFGAYRADLYHNRLITRRGVPSRGQGLLEFARDAGAYEPSRTEAIDRTRFAGLDVSRTRVVDASADCVADRTLVFLERERVVLVVDTVFVQRAGFHTLAQLFHGQHLRHVDAGSAVLANTDIGGRELPGARELLLRFPGDDAPGTFRIERDGRLEHGVHQHVARHFDRGAIVHLVAVLVPVPRGPSAAATAHAPEIAWLSGLDHDPRALCVRIGAWTIGIRADLEAGRLPGNVRPRSDATTRSLAFGPLTTDADFVAWFDGPRERRWMATHVTRVALDGRVVFEAPLANFFQPTGRSDVRGRAAWRRWEETLPR